MRQIPKPTEKERKQMLGKSTRRDATAFATAALILASVMLTGVSFVVRPAAATLVSSKLYTLNSDFDQGVLVGVNHNVVPNQLQLNMPITTFPFIWVPNSPTGTISRIDTVTGRELGRYYVAPPSIGGNPSRTTVAADGSVWVGNRQAGTVIHVGIPELSQCIDRNHDGIIETSSDTNGDGNIEAAELLPWGQDECVLQEVVLIPGEQGTFAPGTFAGTYDTNYWGTAPRGLAIDAKGNVWAGTWSIPSTPGLVCPSPLGTFYYIDGSTGVILKSVDVSSLGFNSYGATIDKNGVVWSASLCDDKVLRLDPSTNPPTVTAISLPQLTYGIGQDYSGHVFVTGFSNNVLTRINIATSGVDFSVPTLPGCARGVVATANISDYNNIWTADTCRNSVIRYDNNGNFLAEIPGFSAPTGVAVDSAGKVWVTDLGNEFVHRIDPLTNTIDLSKQVIGSGGHYSYSDMTGEVSRTITNPQGTWTVVFDSGQAGTPWGTVSWNTENAPPCPATPQQRQPSGTSISAGARSSETIAGLGGTAFVNAPNGVKFSAPNGRYLQVEVKLTTTIPGVSPIVCDVTIQTAATIKVSKFFTDSSLNPLPLDSNGNPAVNVTLANGQVRSTNPGQVLVWVNVTNTAGSPLQSLKLTESLPIDWNVDPPWKPGLGAIHVFYANTTSLATNPEITQPSTITVATGNPQKVSLAIANFTATTIGHPLMPGQSILLSVKLTYALTGSTQSASSYPRSYTDTATAAAWTQPSFTSNQFTGTGSAFFVADAKVVS